LDRDSFGGIAISWTYLAVFSGLSGGTNTETQAKLTTADPEPAGVLVEAGATLSLI